MELITLIPKTRSETWWAIKFLFLSGESQCDFRFSLYAFPDCTVFRMLITLGEIGERILRTNPEHTHQVQFRSTRHNDEEMSLLRQIFLRIATYLLYLPGFRNMAMNGILCLSRVGT